MLASEYILEGAVAMWVVYAPCRLGGGAKQSESKWGDAYRAQDTTLN